MQLVQLVAFDGRGPIPFNTADPAWRAFLLRLAAGTTVDYMVVQEDGTAWEYGTGTITADGTLTFGAVTLSSAGGATPITFTAGRHAVLVTRQVAAATSFSYSTQGGNFNAAVNNGYVITANCTATLPSTGTRGDKIAFYVRDGVTSFIVGRNTRDIQNLAEDMTVSRSPVSFTLVFDDTTNGWWLE